MRIKEEVKREVHSLRSWTNVFHAAKISSRAQRFASLLTSSSLCSAPFFLLLTLFSLTLSSCLNSGEVRIKGSFTHLEQAELFIYSPDGGLDHLDTLRVQSGKFTWTTPLNADATFYIIYPNMTEQVVFASPGDDIKLEGDGGQLKSVKVSGNEENKLLTKFRLDHNGDKRDSLIAAMKRFVKQHPDSRVSTHLQREINDYTFSSSRLRVGGQLPPITLAPDSLSDNYRIDSLATDKPILLAFWASWRSGSNVNFRIRRLLRKHGQKSIQPICISLDTDPKLYRMFIRQDSVDWVTRCYRSSWDTPVVKQLSIRTIPFLILADKDHKIRALGNNWEKDIQPELDKLLGVGN